MFVRPTGNNAFQVYVHHGFFIPAFYASGFMNDLCSTYMLMILWLEMTSIFLNIRYMCFEWKMDTTIYAQINSLALFVSYTIFRVCFQTYISFYFFYWGYFNVIVKVDEKTALERGQNWYLYQFVGGFMVFANLLSQGLNLFWYTLILKQVNRLV